MSSPSRSSLLVPLAVLAALAAGCNSKPPPEPPVALGDALATLPGVDVQVTLRGVDPDLGPLTYAVATQPSHGTLTGTAPALTYVPAAGYVGYDSFTFTTSNGKATSAPGTVTISMVPTTGTAVAGTEALDLALARTLAGVPGGFSVAIAKDGKLIYARGFGYADETGALFQPDSLLRSTGGQVFPTVAILEFVDQGLVGLDEKLLDLLTDFALPAGGDARIRDITIRHVLLFAAGFGQMWNSGTPATCREIFQGMLSQPLARAPGSTGALTDFYYCVSALIVEKVSGKDAQTAIRDMLAPVGIHSVRLAGSKRADRAPGEVAYFSPDLLRSWFPADAGAAVPSPYGYYSSPLLGAYLASAVDLVRFLDAVAGVGGANSILSASSLATMTTPSGPATGSWLGMDVFRAPGGGTVRDSATGFGAWGTGRSVTGFDSQVAFSTNGYSYAVLMNFRENEYGGGSRYDAVINAVRAGITGSATDLYPSYPSPSLPPYGGQ